MRIVCEPLHNPEPTYGVCDVELLIVVHRDHAELYGPFARFFVGTSGVKVILDRRVAERRVAPGQESHEPRELRKRRIREGTISPFGDFTIVRFAPNGPLVPEAVEVNQRA
jgi:hypothetical protein